MTSGLSIAVSVVLTCVIITMGIYLSRQGQDAGNAVGQMNNNIIAAIEDSELNDYITDEVTGADVVNFIRKFHEDLDIFTLQRTSNDMQNGSNWQGTNIITSGNDDLALNYNVLAWNERDPAGIVKLSDGAKTYDFSVKNYAGNKYLLEDNNFSKNIPGTGMYINPNNKYNGFAIKNANGVVTGMYFVQVDNVQVAITPWNGGNGGNAGNAGNAGVPNAGNENGAAAGGTVDTNTVLAISQTVNAIANTVEKLTTEITSIRSDIVSAVWSGGSNTTAVGGESGSTSNLQSQIDSLSEQYTSLTTALNDVKSALQGMTTSTDISDLKSGISGNASALNELNGKLENITAKLREVEEKLALITASTGGTGESGESGVSETTSLTALSEVNAELTSVVDMILDVTSAVGSDSAKDLGDSVQKVKNSLEDADEVTSTLSERATK